MFLGVLASQSESEKEEKEPRSGSTYHTVPSPSMVCHPEKLLLLSGSPSHYTGHLRSLTSPTPGSVSASGRKSSDEPHALWAQAPFPAHPPPLHGSRVTEGAAGTALPPAVLVTGS